MRSEGVFEIDVDQTCICGCDIPQDDRDIMFATKVVSVLAGRDKTAQIMGNNKLPVPQGWSVSQVSIHAVALAKVNGMINVVDFDCPRAISKLDSYNDELEDFVAAFAAWGGVSLEIVDAVLNLTLVCKEANVRRAMIGGAPFFMSTLERVLVLNGIKPLYAFSERVSEETTAPDGAVTKINVFKHIGFVDPTTGMEFSM